MTPSIAIYKPDTNAPQYLSTYNVEKETEKAWGIRINVGNFDGRYKIEWFPKSQGDVIKTTTENNEERLHVSFPDWILRSKGILNSYK